MERIYANALLTLAAVLRQDWHSQFIHISTDHARRLRERILYRLAYGK